MNNLLIEVNVPSIGKSFDISIPRNAKIFELLPLVTSAVTQLSDGLFVSNEAALYDGKTGGIFNRRMSADDLELKNGSLLMLI